MNAHPLTRRCLIAVFMIAGVSCVPDCHRGESRVPLAVGREAWSYRSIPGTTLTTPHYRIHTTCNDSALLGTIPKVMEGALDAYRAAVPSDNLPAELMPAYLFASRPQWEW